MEQHDRHLIELYTPQAFNPDLPERRASSSGVIGTRHVLSLTPTPQQASGRSMASDSNKGLAPSAAACIGSLSDVSALNEAGRMHAMRSFQQLLDACMPQQLPASAPYFVPEAASLNVYSTADSVQPFGAMQPIPKSSPLYTDIDVNDLTAHVYSRL